MDSQSKYLAWKEERRQIDEARINRQRTAPGRWIREWDRNKPLTPQQRDFFESQKENVRHPASVTSVTEECGQKTTEGTCPREQKRRHNSRPLEIIDHGKLRNSVGSQVQTEPKQPSSSGASLPNSVHDQQISRVVRSVVRPRSLKISTRNAITSASKQISLENELQRPEDVRQKMQRRFQNMERSGIFLREQMALLKEAQIVEERLKQDGSARFEAEEEYLAQQIEVLGIQDQQLDAQRITKLQKNIEKEAKAQRLKNKEWRLLIEKMLTLQTNFTAIYKDFSSVSEYCKYRNICGPALGESSTTIEELTNCMDGLVARARNGKLTKSDVTTAEILVKRSVEIRNTFKFEIGRINAAYDARIARKDEVKCAQARERAEESQKSKPPPPGIESQEKSSDHQKPSNIVYQIKTNSAELQPSQASISNDDKKECLLDFVDKDSLKLHLNSRQYLENHRVICSFIMDSDSTKKFRSECQKAIVTQVNAISNTSGDHLRERYNLLHDTLAGRGSFDANQHPQGIDFCKYILAKRFVSQAEKQIAIKRDSAFPFAAVAVALWSDYPDFGKLLLASFHKTCPYLVPIFLPQKEGQSKEDSYKSLGYLYEDNIVERHEENEFIKRMSGVMRLYATVIVAKQRRGVNTPHPHGLQMAWRWLAAILNIEPRPKICATLILDMLEVAGNALWRVYPKQFPKLLAVLATSYYPRMQSLNDETASGPMCRLEVFLRECRTNGSIPPPHGELSKDFW